MSLYAVLGETELDIIAWLDGFEARFAAEWPAQGLIGRKSLIQHTGYAPDEVRLRVLLHSQWCDPGVELQKLKARLDAAAPLPFVLGTGEYRGVFVLTEVSTTTRQTDGYGALIALEAEIALKECVGDPAEPAAPAIVLPGWRAPVTAGGDVVDVPVPTVFAGSPTGDAAAAIGRAVSAIGLAAGAVDGASSLAAVAQADPLAAVSLAGPVAQRLASAGAAMPVDAVSAISAVASAAGALADARNTLAHGASVLDAATPDSILWRAQSALASGRDAMARLDAARPALASVAATIASRAEVAA